MVQLMQSDMRLSVLQPKSFPAFAPSNESHSKRRQLRTIDEYRETNSMLLRRCGDGNRRKESPIHVFAVCQRWRLRSVTHPPHRSTQVLRGGKWTHPTMTFIAEIKKRRRQRRRSRDRTSKKRKPLKHNFQRLPHLICLQLAAYCSVFSVQCSEFTVHLHAPSKLESHSDAGKWY